MRPRPVEDAALDGGLRLVGELLARVRKDFDPVVAVRVVRGRDDQARVVTDQARDAGDRRGGENTAQVDAAAGLDDTARQGRLDGGARFACITADDDARRAASRGT